jgi:ABC-type nitrate/sulfonate/bicarbonate transport system ATPase subunit/ABC-type transporter Mla maintaining outer membrane lipid asymmetry permease subunit MlaE
VNSLPVFAIENLTITTPTGKMLVQEANLSLGNAELALLVGPSGSGKSTLIKLLSGLLNDDEAPWQVEGILSHETKTYDLSKDRCDIGALVFQNYALFDDLSASANLRIALDHADRPDKTLVGHTLNLLTDIEPDQSIASSSGGQRQRIAIARTLLANRPLLLFDEPNSGLDPYTAQRLGILIRDLCQRMERPALIVAHHVDDLLPLVDAVYLLDPRTHRLQTISVNREAVDAALLAAGQTLATDTASIEAVTANVNVNKNWETKLKPRSPQRWFLRYLQEYFWILWGTPMMLLYIFSGSAIVGFVIMWFGFNYDLLGDAARSFVHDDALKGIGFIEINIGVPLIACILMVARNNAIITADLGNRVLSSQFLAMHNLHIPGQRYITTAIMLNMLVGGLVLVTTSLAVSSLMAYYTWHLIFPGQPFELWQEHFFRAMLPGTKGWNRLIWVVAKVLLSSACGAWLAIHAGLTRKDSVIAVNYAIARSIILGVTATLLVHAGIAVLVY